MKQRPGKKKQRVLREGLLTAKRACVRMPRLSVNEAGNPLTDTTI